MKPTNKDWSVLKKKVNRAKRTETVARVTQEFDEKFDQGGGISVYDDGIMLAEELAEYALENIKWGLLPHKF